MSRLAKIGALVLGTWAMTAVVADAARLDYAGRWLSDRQVSSLLAPALRARSDSVALTAGLGAIVARLQDEGFLEARASGEWSGDDRLRVVVREGERYRLGAIEVRGLSTRDSAIIGGALGLVPGAPASGSAVGAAMERALDAASESGYPYASVLVSGWEPDSSGVRLALTGGLGPVVTVTGVRFDGIHATRVSLLERAVGPIAGPYRASAARAARDRVDRLGLFRSVELGELEGAADLSLARLVMNVEERSYNRIEGAIGAQGNHEVVGLARVELDNLAGTGRALAVRWDGLGQGITHLDARYSEPFLFGLPLGLDLAINQQVYDTLYTQSRGVIGGRWTMASGERLEASYELERVIQPDHDVRQAGTQATRLAWARDRRDDLVAPRRGTAMRFELEQAFTREKLRSSDERTVRSGAAGAVTALHVPLRKGSGLALELRAAGRTSTGQVLPVYDRYPLGGAASLRGYDEEEFRVDAYGLSRLEWRWFLPKRQHAFAFWDHATAMTRLAEPDGVRRQQINRDGMGLGLDLETPAGHVGVMYGVAAGRGPLEGKIHLRLVSPF